ncbi:MAG TPA: hypothetical protein VEO74_19410, partial [Thermoanaerobaculia bacterium]|nr:hypothetical protein [Thermoanaerobaculia bacterium]
VPHITRANIEWREGAAYDDWDEIAQLLYDKIVVASALWALPDDERSTVEFPSYNMAYASYADKTVIVVNEKPDDERLVFHSFTTQQQPFDTARTAAVDEEGQVCGEFVLVPADTATYRIHTPARALAELVVDV